MENNCMDISSEKQAKSHTGRLGHGLEREISIEKLNTLQKELKITPSGPIMLKQQ